MKKKPKQNVVKSNTYIEHDRIQNFAHLDKVTDPYYNYNEEGYEDAGFGNFQQNQFLPSPTNLPQYPPLNEMYTLPAEFSTPRYFNKALPKPDIFENSNYHNYNTSDISILTSGFNPKYPENTNRYMQEKIAYEAHLYGPSSPAPYAVTPPAQQQFDYYSNSYPLLPNRKSAPTASYAPQLPSAPYNTGQFTVPNYNTGTFDATNQYFQQPQQMDLVDHTYTLDVTQLNNFNPHVQKFAPTYRQPYSTDVFNAPLQTQVDVTALTFKSQERIKNLDFLYKNNYISYSQYLKAKNTVIEKDRDESFKTAELNIDFSAAKKTAK